MNKEMYLGVLAGAGADITYFLIPPAQWKLLDAQTQLCEQALIYDCTQYSTVTSLLQYCLKEKITIVGEWVAVNY